jgi:hypothetical protein
VSTCLIITDLLSSALRWYITEDLGTYGTAKHRDLGDKYTPDEAEALKYIEDSNLIAGDDDTGAEDPAATAESSD